MGYFGVSPFNYYIVQFKVILYLTNYYASQLKVCSGISYAATAAIAHQKKRSKLAALLLDYESQSSEQVLFLDILIFVFKNLFIGFLFGIKKHFNQETSTRDDELFNLGLTGWRTQRRSTATNRATLKERLAIQDRNSASD